METCDAQKFIYIYIHMCNTICGIPTVLDVYLAFLVVLCFCWCCLQIRDSPDLRKQEQTNQRCKLTELAKYECMYIHNTNYVRLYWTNELQERRATIKGFLLLLITQHGVLNGTSSSYSSCHTDTQPTQKTPQPLWTLAAARVLLHVSRGPAGSGSAPPAPSSGTPVLSRSPGSRRPGWPGT